MANRKRKSVVTIYLDDAEKTHLERLTSAAGCSKSEVIRNLITGTVPSIPPSTTEKDMLRILRGIGTNLNQIALQTNSGAYPRSTSLDKVMETAQESMEQFQRYLAERSVWKSLSAETEAPAPYDAPLPIKPEEPDLVSASDFDGMEDLLGLFEDGEI